jgi:hypothetical protein
LLHSQRQPTPSSSSSSSSSEGSDIESCFDTGDGHEETDAETEPTDVDTGVDGDDKADLPDLEWLAREDNADTVPADVDTDVDGDDEADLAWAEDCPIADASPRDEFRIMDGYRIVFVSDDRDRLRRF